jgi:hypothetical protein
MRPSTQRPRLTPLPAAAFLALISLVTAEAQFGGPPPGPRGPAKTVAPFDLTGYWVSLITEDWRFRMITPPKGDFAGVPLNGAGRMLANAWDAAKDEAAGEQCKAYGAAALMRVPGRFHITWLDDNTLKIEADAGTQTRLLHFGPAGAAPGPASWQGYSTAEWQPALGGRAGRGGQGQPGAAARRGGSLKVTTTNLKAGYLRKNGVPYSANASVTEFYDLLHESNGSTWVVVKTIVTDPTYLTGPFITSTNLRLQADDKGWSPSACDAR